MRIQRLKATRSLQLERLENRQVMATFGVPWPEPRSLSVSFPSDNASIGAFPNSIRERFDQVADRAQWQYEALRAFQTWAAVTNINVGLVPDRGDDFGAVGLSSNDPRFGEIRIGAFPQGTTLANAAPFDPLSGTWSGDVLLNTETNYFLADWNSTSPITIPNANANGPAVELYSVLLHEAGNALGLEDTRTVGTVMNGTYSGPRGQLSSSDIAAIRRLYGGPRRDIYEPTSNNALVTSTPINRPAGHNLSQPISIMGSLNTRTDVDVYRFNPIRGQQNVSVRLWASGISLLKSQIEVLDRTGNVIASAKADSIFANNLQLDIGSLSDHPLLYVRVSRNANDSFAIGDYRLDLDYRELSQQPSIIPPAHDADAQDEDNDTVDFVSVDQLFANGLVDLESGLNDTLPTATSLLTPAGYLPRSRYEVVSSVSSSTDRDLWRFQTPQFASPVMTINVDALGIENPVLEAYVLNSVGDRLGAQAVRKADGGITLTVNSPGSLRNYVVFVRSQANSTIAAGNYAITVDFTTDPANQLTELYSAQVSPTQEHVSQLRVLKTQLMRFDLSTLGNSSSAGVQLTVYNARTGDIELTLSARSASTSIQYAWLSQGSYYLRATHRTRTGFTAAPMASFRVRVDVLSDDQGPRPNDPTQLPDPNVNNEFQWVPEDVQTIPPIINFNEPPVEDPWNNNNYQQFTRNFITLLLA